MLGGQLTVAAHYKTARAVVVLAPLLPEHLAALVDKGYTVIEMPDPAQWNEQFCQHPHAFG